MVQNYTFYQILYVRYKVYAIHYRLIAMYNYVIFRTRDDIEHTRQKASAGALYMQLN